MDSGIQVSQSEVWYSSFHMWKLNRVLPHRPWVGTEATCRPPIGRACLPVLAGGRGWFLWVPRPNQWGATRGVGFDRAVTSLGSFRIFELNDYAVSITWRWQSPVWLAHFRDGSLPSAPETHVWVPGSDGGIAKQLALCVLASIGAQMKSNQSRKTSPKEDNGTLCHPKHHTKSP